MTSSELDSRNIAISMRKSVENLVISSQDAIGQSISQALTFSGVITQHANNIIQENRSVSRSPSPSPSASLRNTDSASEALDNDKTSEASLHMPCHAGGDSASVSSGELAVTVVSAAPALKGDNPKSSNPNNKGVDGARTKKKSWYNSLYPTYKSKSDDFKRLFKDLPDDERLIVDYSCALQKDILAHGRLYASQNYLCFYASIFGWETTMTTRWKDVTAITKEKTALVIPNAILVCTEGEKNFLTSFSGRDKAYLMLFRIWQNALMDQPMTSQEFWQWLGGIVQPNDGECHMKGNTYTHSTLQDYPSISQINHKVKKHAINVIFAVTAEQISVYEQLSKHIEGSSTGVLSNDSDNIVDLVREQYNKITSAVEMKDSSSDAVQIVYYSSCLSGKELIQTNKCDGLKVGDVVEFTAEITLKECPKDRSKWRQTFDISPVGISDSLVVDLEMVCDCPCEQPGHHAYNDSPLVCSGEGVSACGVCVCAPGRFGKSCECSAHGGVSAEQERGCRPTNASSGPLCSNRGTCICGVCECNKMDDPLKVISGPFCECDNFTCDMNKGLLCSGPDHGECVCGKCSCTADYTGPACQCLKDQTPCRSPENNEICSGNGQCVCGQCMCNSDDDRHYSGKYCEKCPTCPGRCGEFKDCVLCEVHKRGPKYNADTDTCGDCALFPIVEEGKIEANESRNEHLCSFYDDEDCLYVYVYSYNENQQLVIRAQKERECPKKVPILGIVLGVIAAIVLVGLALLMLWKMATTIHDRREFARFEKERMMAKWDTGENPIYKQATSTFKNPTYAGK